MNFGPITSYNYVNSAEYQAEMDRRRPQPRIRSEYKWIKEVSESGSIGVLIELQSLQSRLENLRVIERDKLIKSNRGESSIFQKRDPSLNKNNKSNQFSKETDIRNKKNYIKNIDQKEYTKMCKYKSKKEMGGSDKEEKIFKEKYEKPENSKEKDHKYKINKKDKHTKEYHDCGNSIKGSDEDKSNKKVTIIINQKSPNSLSEENQNNCCKKNTTKKIATLKYESIQNHQEKGQFKSEHKNWNLSGYREYLHSHAITGPPLDVEIYPPVKKLNLKDTNRIRASVPTALSAKKVTLKRREIDFIKANAFALDSGWYKKNLNKSNLIKDKSVSPAESNSDISKGRLLSPSEQRKIMAKLNDDLQLWYKELNCLPISMATLRIQNKKKLIEERIKEVESCLDMFKRGKVFIEQYINLFYICMYLRVRRA